MKSFRNYEKGEIVSALCRFSEEQNSKTGAVENANAKHRPAVVISDLGNNLIVCEITKAKREAQFELSLFRQDFKTGAMPFKSYIRADKIQTVSKVNIGRQYGILKYDKVKEIIETIHRIVDLSSSVQKSKALQRPPKPKPKPKK